MLALNAALITPVGPSVTCSAKKHEQTSRGRPREIGPVQPTDVPRELRQRGADAYTAAYERNRRDHEVQGHGVEADQRAAKYEGNAQMRHKAEHD